MTEGTRERVSDRGARVKQAAAGPEGRWVCQERSWSGLPLMGWAREAVT